MSIFDWEGNYVKDSDDGKDYFLSQDGLNRYNMDGNQVDSIGNVAFGSWGDGPREPEVKRKSSWRPLEVQSYRPPNFNIQTWRDT